MHWIDNNHRLWVVRQFTDGSWVTKLSALSRVRDLQVSVLKVPLNADPTWTVADLRLPIIPRHIRPSLPVLMPHTPFLSPS